MIATSSAAVTRPSRLGAPTTVALGLESHGPGGAEYVVLYLAEELQRRGYAVCPVLPTPASGWLATEFRARGIEPATFEMRHWIDVNCLRQLVAALRQQRVDLVHSHEFSMAVYGAAAARVLGLPHVITMHGNQAMTARWRRRVALRWALRRSYATVAVSEDTRNHLARTLGVRGAQIRTIVNGIPAPRAGDRHATRAELGVGAEDVLIVSVGNLTPRKAHIVLLRALEELQRGGCSVPWRLVIAGDGPERKRLAAFAKEHGQEHLVSLPGHRDDVADLLAAADIFALPSLWEGLPLAILEAMFAGAAIVASEISGIPEAVTSGHEALLIPPGDHLALARALQALLEHPARRQALGRAALHRARARFTVERMTGEYEQLYANHSVAGSHA